MSSLRPKAAARLAGFGCAWLLSGGLAAGVFGTAQADPLRPAIAAPLQAAERDLSLREFGPALRHVQQAAAVPDKSPAEILTIEQVRAAIDASRQDYGAAAADYAAIIASDGLPPAEVTLLAQAEASSDYQAGNYAGAIATIRAYLPGDPRFTTILLQSYLKLGQCEALDDAVGRLASPPPEADLQIAAYCDASAKDNAFYRREVAALVQDYPSPAYWAELLGLEQANPDFSGNLAVDFFRLKLAARVPASATEYMDMTEAALQAGLPNIAEKFIGQGFSAGILGSGPDAARQLRLKALVAKRQAAANTGTAQQIQQAQRAQDEASLFTLGLNEVDGGNASGLALMAGAIRSGGLTQPDPAELELGIGYWEAGQVANADAMWRAVQGGGSAAELAKLWTYLR